MLNMHSVAPIQIWDPLISCPSVVLEGESGIRDDVDVFLVYPSHPVHASAIRLSHAQRCVLLLNRARLKSGPQVV